MFWKKKTVEPGAGTPDAQLLGILAQHGDLSQPRDWLQFLYFKDEAAARDAFAEAQREGWQAYNEVWQDPQSGDWSVSLRRSDLPVDADTVARARAFFEGLAARHSGEYDGWEAAAG